MFLGNCPIRFTRPKRSRFHSRPDRGCEEIGDWLEWHSDQANDPGRRQNVDWLRGGKSGWDPV